MSKTFVSIFAAVCVTLILTADVVQAQTCTRPSQNAWVAVRDNGAGRDTVRFGYDGTATYGLNTALCEIELPPAPPTGVFDVRWVNIPGREGTDTPAGMGQGFKEDYRQFVSAAKIDTHKVKFQPSDAGFPFTFNWNISGILAVCDSAILQDEFGGAIVKVRMHAVDNAVVSNAAFSSLLLIRFGQRATSVTPIDDVIPAEFALMQNYPNPFNPSTTIRFAVARLAKTEIAVFDVLGRQVSTLVSENLAPGVYDVQWNGTNNQGLAVTSGIYFVQMRSLDETNANFSDTRKLVLMK